MPARCEFLSPDGRSECGRPAAAGISVARWFDDTWRVWPACARHAGALARELRGVPGYAAVSEPWALGDDAAASRAEWAAEVAAGLSGREGPPR